MYYCIHLLFKVLKILSLTTDFPSLFVEYISISLSCKDDFIDILQKSPLSTNILFDLQLYPSKTF